MHRHSEPPLALAFIDVERQKKGHKNCPLCGSLHSGTVDHQIPRTLHPAFSIFSRNLVRACKCNSIKNDAISGILQVQRILHPYFDDCMAKRLVRAEIRDYGPAPKISLQILMDRLDPDFPAVEYHVNRIVDRTQVKEFLHDRWAKLIRKPTNLVPMLSNTFATKNELVGIINDQCCRTDDVNESLNNWESIFLSGLLEEQTLNRLFLQLTAPGYVAGSSLAWV